MTASLDRVENGSLLHRELWSSWAGVLRSYAAVHSLGRPYHPVIEVSELAILLRYGTRWMRFTFNEIEVNGTARHTFCLTVNGQAVVDSVEEEMDLAAERLTREIIVA